MIGRALQDRARSDRVGDQTHDECGEAYREHFEKGLGVEGHVPGVFFSPSPDCTGLDRRGGQ